MVEIISAILKKNTIDVLDKMIKEEKNKDVLSKREVIDESIDKEEAHKNEYEESEDEEFIDRMDEKLKTEEDFVQETVIIRLKNAVLLEELE